MERLSQQLSFLQKIIVLYNNTRIYFGSLNAPSILRFGHYAPSHCNFIITNIQKWQGKTQIFYTNVISLKVVNIWYYTIDIDSPPPKHTLLQLLRENTLLLKETPFQNPRAFHPSWTWCHCNLIITNIQKWQWQTQIFYKKHCLFKSCEHRLLPLESQHSIRRKLPSEENVHSGVKQKQECVYQNGVNRKMWIITNDRLF